MLLKRFLLVLMLSLSLFACISKEKEDVGSGVKLVRDGDIVNVYSERDFLAMELKLDSLKVIVEEDENLYISNENKLSIASLKGGIKKGEKLFSIESKDGISAELTCAVGELGEFSIRAGEKLLGDFDGNDGVDLVDLNSFKDSYNSSNGDGNYNISYDIYPSTKGTGKWGNIYAYSNGDGKVDLYDFVIFAKNYGLNKPSENLVLTEVRISGKTSIELEEIANYTAKVLYDDGSTSDVIVNWEVTGNISYESNGNILTLTGTNLGSINIIASYGELSSSFDLEVVSKKIIFDGGIKVHAKGYPYVYSWEGANSEYEEVVNEMTDEGNGWYGFTFLEEDSIKMIFRENGADNWSGKTGDLIREARGEYWYDKGWYDVNPDIDITAPAISTSPKAGSFEETTLNITINLEDKDSEAKAYYTIDGTDPKVGENPYNGEIAITEDATVKVIAVDSAGNISDISEFKYNLDVDITAPRVIATPKPGTYPEPITVTLEVEDNRDNNPSLYYSLNDGEPTEDFNSLYSGQGISIPEGRTVIKVLLVDNAGNKKTERLSYFVGERVARKDFREESVYFLMTPRFYDGDLSNTRTSPCYESSGNSLYNDPSWRGDFKGLIEKLDYIKALGFSAVWITPPVLNRNYYDYHGYHGWDFTKIDGRLESPGATYQDLIDEIHARDMKIMQDIVLNHSGRYGFKDQCEIKYWGDRDDPDWGKDSEINYYDEYNPDFEYDGVSIEPKSGKSWYNGDLWQKEKPELPWEAADEFYWWNGSTYSHADDLDNLWGVASPYHSPEGYQVYHFQWPGMYESQFSLLDPEWFHRFWLKNWEDYTCQLGTIHEDCLDLNTESKVVQDYMLDAYGNYIRMGVDAFRVDTVKHISRNTLNRRFNQQFHEIAAESGNDNFYMAGEVCVRDHGVWNKGNVALSQPFYTWKERGTFSDDDLEAAHEAYDYEVGRGSDDQPTSDNHLLNGNEYHEPDYSEFSGMNVIDFRMHWNFSSASTAFGVREGDEYTNDATWNMPYVESHDYSPKEVGNSLYARMDDPDVMAENWSLMFTWRGIPTIFYGNEILFKAGEIIDEGPNRALEESGRAYFGPHLEGSVEVQDFGEYSNATGEMANTLSHPLAQHVRRLNLIRRAIPALQKGQYSTEDIEGDIAFKRRYTNLDEGVDSFALVTVTNSATFTNIPAGTYVDVVTGDRQIVSAGGSLTATCSGVANLRVYVLENDYTGTVEVIGEAGDYIK